MDDLDRFSEIALYIGAASLACAGVSALFRQTRNVPAPRRIVAMAQLVVSTVWSFVPSRCALASTAAGFLAFAGTLVVGLALTILILCLIPRSVKHPTEAYEGIGDAIIAMLCLGFGAVISLCVALVVGLIAGERAAFRRGATSAPNEGTAANCGSRI